MPLTIRPITAKDEPAVLDVFRRAPGYFLRVEGKEADEGILRNEIDSGPRNRAPEYRKDFLLILQGGAPIGAVELILNHPQKPIAYIGLFLLAEELQGRGIGRAAYAVLEQYCRDNGMDRIRLGVSEDNDVGPFWRKLGFAPNGRSYEYHGVYKTTRSAEYEKGIGG